MEKEAELLKLMSDSIKTMQNAVVLIKRSRHTIDKAFKNMEDAYNLYKKAEDMYLYANTELEKLI